MIYFLHLLASVSISNSSAKTNIQLLTFQFSPTDSSKVIVTSADSVIRILSGADVICKFKGMFWFYINYFGVNTNTCYYSQARSQIFRNSSGVYYHLKYSNA